MLKKSDVVEFLQHLLSEGRTPTTVNKVKRYLTSPFESARKEGLLDYNPFAAVKSLKATTVEKDSFSPAMVWRLVEAALGTDWEGAILVGYTTGARLQDVTNLRWSDIDSENGVLSFVQRKTGKRALVGLHDELRDWIVRQRPPDDPDAYLFPTLASRRSGGSLGLSMEFSALMARAGVDPKFLRIKEPGRRACSVRSLTFHSFRHGAATAVFNNAALKDIARRVTTHAEKGSLHRYIQHDIEAIRAAANLIPRLPKT